MTVLITGGSGQDGHYLAKLCAERGANVIRTSRSDHGIRLDVTDAGAVEALIKETRPDFVFHFAAESTAAHDALRANHGAIGGGTANLLEACWRHCRGARVFLPGTALQFENRGRPIDEDTPFQAASAYAAARIYSVYLARYFRGLGLRCYVGYLFHHDSPLRTSRHLSQRIACAAVDIAAGGRTVLEVGNLAMEKEWVFAGDSVRAIWTLVNQETVFEAVVGSGEAAPLSAWIEACFTAVGLDWREWTREIPSYRADFQRLVSNPARIRQLGWQPEVTLAGLAAIMVRTPVVAAN